MAKVFPGRYTAQIEGPFVVFLIGMRVNRIFAFHKWIPVANAMPGMLKELYKSPESGFLGAQFFINWRGVSVAQYWRSFEHLHAYAHARDKRHLPAWAAFNRAIGGNGSVGIWHETYMIQPGNFECIYANMPRFGLAQAAEHVPVVGRTDTAKGRIDAQS
jgi:hypothetical protein